MSNIFRTYPFKKKHSEEVFCYLATLPNIAAKRHKLRDQNALRCTTLTR